MEFDLDKTKGDVIEGDINVEADGYFNISTPYDEGFTLYVDGQETAHEITDTAFIGLPLSAGEHHIRLEYHAPGANAGRIVSAFAWIVFFTFVFIDRKKTAA